MAKPVTTDYAFLNEERGAPGLGPVTLTSVRLVRLVRRNGTLLLPQRRHGNLPVP